MIPLQNRRIAVIGSGVEGKSAQTYLLKHGADVHLYDSTDDIDTLAAYQLVVRSPGIRPDHPHLVEAAKNGVEITSATKLFFANSPTKNIIGVTGTKGKGTTSTLIYEMLRASYRDAYLGGNIGTPPLDFIDSLTAESWVVLELSSFQLMDLTVSPHIAVVLMVTSEHMDWHHSKEEYVNAKAPLVAFQTDEDFVIYNSDYANSVLIAKQSEAEPYEVSARHPVETGVYIEDGDVVLSDGGMQSTMMGTDTILLPGQHNWENVCAAAAAAYVAGVTHAQIQKATSTFVGLEHRIEPVRELGGVQYYNDSFSTVPETAIAAITAFAEPKVLILGGSEKQSDFNELANTITASADSIRGIIGIGREWKRIKEALTEAGYKPQTPYVEGLSDMEEIVHAARTLAKSGDVVLLSPACASFDMFENYKERGAKYKEAVTAL